MRLQRTTCCISCCITPLASRHRSRTWLRLKGTGAGGGSKGGGVAGLGLAGPLVGEGGGVALGCVVELAVKGVAVGSWGVGVDVGSAVGAAVGMGTAVGVGAHCVALLLHSAHNTLNV